MFPPDAAFVSLEVVAVSGEVDAAVKRRGEVSIAAAMPIRTSTCVFVRKKPKSMG